MSGSRHKWPTWLSAPACQARSQMETSGAGTPSPERSIETRVFGQESDSSAVTRRSLRSSVRVAVVVDVTGSMLRGLAQLNCVLRSIGFLWSGGRGLVGLRGACCIEARRGADWINHSCYSLVSLSAGKAPSFSIFGRGETTKSLCVITYHLSSCRRRSQTKSARLSQRHFATGGSSPPFGPHLPRSV